MIVGLGIYGCGMGLIMAQISNLSLSAVPARDAGEASGLNNTFRQIGQSLGSAIIGSVLLTALAAQVQLHVSQSPLIPADVKPDIARALTEEALSMEHLGAALSSSIPPHILQTIGGVMRESMTYANRQALLYAAFFALLGFLVSFSLPNVKDLERGDSSGGH